MSQHIYQFAHFVPVIMLVYLSIFWLHVVTWGRWANGHNSNLKPHTPKLKVLWNVPNLRVFRLFVGCLGLVPVVSWFSCFKFNMVLNIFSCEIPGMERPANGSDGLLEGDWGPTLFGTIGEWCQRDVFFFCFMEIHGVLPVGGDLKGEIFSRLSILDGDSPLIPRDNSSYH